MDKYQEEKMLIKKIVEIFATIDDRDMHVWGKDTDLGSYHEIAQDVRDILKHLIISPLMIEKDIADMMRKLQKRVVEAEKRANKQKSANYGDLCNLEIKKEKEMEELKHNFSVMAKEYDKLLREWHQLKYGKPTAI